MQKTGLLLDLSFTEHDPGEYHPEAPGRIEAIHKQLKADHLIEKCRSIELRDANDDELLLVHTDSYLKTVLREIDGKRSGMLSTGDTNFGPRSLDIAKQAAGSLLNAVDLVMKDKLRNAFCAIRPPGHHASQGRGMGVLHLQQCGDCSSICAEVAWGGACCHHRLGCSSRKRNAGYFL